MVKEERCSFPHLSVLMTEMIDKASVWRHCRPSGDHDFTSQGNQLYFCEHCLLPNRRNKRKALSIVCCGSWHEKYPLWFSL